MYNYIECPKTYSWPCLAQKLIYNMEELGYSLGHLYMSFDREGIAEYETLKILIKAEGRGKYKIALPEDTPVEIREIFDCNL